MVFRPARLADEAAAPGKRRSRVSDKSTAAIRGDGAVQSTSQQSTHAPVDVGAKVRELRKASGRTLKEVAEAADISVSYLSQIERNVSRLPIDVLRRICEALGVHLNWLFPPEQKNSPDADVLVRANERRTLSFPGLGITEELLSPTLSGPLELLISTIAPGADSEFYTHDGHEAGVVLDGTLELWIGSRHLSLERGDSFDFSSATPHRCRNTTAQPVRVLWVITPPHY